jgi:transglutaminase-like putative cysteine protease
MSAAARRRVVRLGLAVAMLGGAVVMLQWPVRTRQGWNGQVTERTVPLWLKTLRFLTRDAEYRHLAAQLTRGCRDDEARVMALYAWVRSRVYPGIPDGMPVVDDHVWDIMVRGYGTPDQHADVLATLCAYAGVPAELAFLGPRGGRPFHAVALVWLNGRWCPVDPYYGVIVRHPVGRPASREEILAEPELIERQAPPVTIRGVAYAQLYRWLPDVRLQDELRPYRHNPFIRIWYELRRGLQMLVG